MRLLLDTHALIWWLTDSTRLSAGAVDHIGRADAVFVSAVSAYEIAQKFRLGKLPMVERLATGFDEEAAAEGFGLLPLSTAEAQHAGLMEGEHRDPFDRLLVAQALMNDLAIVSNDTVFDRFGVSRIW